MIVIEWVNRHGNPRRICIGSKEACGAFKPLGTVSSNSGDDTSLSINGKLYSKDAAIFVDKARNFGFISKTPSELAFKNSNEKAEMFNLQEVMIEFKSTKERFSVNTLISIIESEYDDSSFEKEKDNCACKS